MKKLISAFLILFCVTGIAQQQRPGVVYDVVLTRVIDGDTVAFQANWLPDPLKKELSIRVFGVDTPEKGFRAKCPEEDARGQAATAFTKSQVNASQKRQVFSTVVIRLPEVHGNSSITKSFLINNPH